jgi:general secretion pathway protein G
MQYSVKFRRLLSEPEGLNALLEASLTDDDSLFEDPWGNTVMYRMPGIRSGDKFDVYSTGHDGIDGNGDDIGNWEPPAGPPASDPEL